MKKHKITSQTIANKYINNFKEGMQATDNGNPTLYSDQDLNKLIRGTIGAIRWSTFEIAENALKSIQLKQLN